MALIEIKYNARSRDLENPPSALKCFISEIRMLLGTRTTLRATRTIGTLGGSRGLVNSLDSCEITKVDSAEHGLGVPVNLNAGQLEGTLLRNIVVLALPLLLLELEGDAADGTLLDATHQVGGKACNLVAKTLGGDDGDLGGETLVGLEVEGETGVVLFDKVAGGTLHCLCADTTLRKHEYLEVVVNIGWL